ncbi:alpha-1,2-fucosyltransferase [Bacteroidaceae bacterium HV4-6-C5C]|nr:alpha-1,2-fucosyltransferase [Bacteroidaceae bacterium HV4-6-C5C]
MIIIRMWGGLGNQLFQYSFGQYIEKVGNETVFYDISSFGNSDQLRKLEISYLIPELPIKNVRFTQYIGIKNRLFRTLFQCTNTYLSEKQFSLESLANAKGVIFLQGYWQDKIYAEFFPKRKVLDIWRTPNILMQQEKIIRSANIPISLHVRRGDYFSPQNINIYGVCTEKYYKKAIDYIEFTIKGDKQYFVFSDDISWVRENIELPSSSIFIPNYEEISQFSYIYLMSLCKVNIISNSTFSWWGSYLNQHLDKVVISPSVWTFNSKKCLALDSWLKI